MKITMPQLGESVVEGTIGRWLVKPGDQVKKYQSIAEVITDKVNAEIPAPADGIIVALHVGEQETVKVGTLIAELQVVGDEASAPAAPATAPATPVAAPATQTPPALPAAPAASSVVAAVRSAARYSPAVVRLAQEHGVDLSQLTGTGLGGRITRKDVEAYVAARASAVAPAAGEAPAAMAPVRAGAAGVPAPSPHDVVQEVGPIRRRIAEKMVESKREAPHAWTMVEVDVTPLVALREQAKGAFLEREGFNLTYLPFFMKAVAESLREYPALNSTWAEDKIVLKRRINLSLAVAVDDVLAVPVVHDADRLSIYGLAAAANEVIGRARAGKLTLDDVSGGTFTVNNTGAFGSVASAPIINYPQAAILSFEKIVKRPVVLEGDAIAIRSMVNLCISFDHRVLDGLVVGRFMQAVKRRLEAFGPGTELY